MKKILIKPKLKPKQKVSKLTLKQKSKVVKSLEKEDPLVKKVLKKIAGKTPAEAVEMVEIDERTGGGVFSGRFQGFRRHEKYFTTFPNEVLDLMPIMPPVAFYCLLYIWRRTIPFSREWVYISYSQFQKGTLGRNDKRLDAGTGLVRRNIRKGLFFLEAMGLIKVKRHYGGTSEYAIRFEPPLLEEGGVVSPVRLPQSQRRDYPSLNGEGVGKRSSKTSINKSTTPLSVSEELSVRGDIADVELKPVTEKTFKNKTNSDVPLIKKDERLKPVKDGPLKEKTREYLVKKGILAKKLSLGV